MKRRYAIKNAILLLGGSSVLFNTGLLNWSCNPVSEKEEELFNNQEQATLTELVETIIPETDSPGAKELAIHLYVIKVLKNCYEISEQENFKLDLKQLDQLSYASYKKSFADCILTERVDFLNNIESGKTEDDQLVSFIGLIKGLTIRGYLYSEYILTNKYVYELAPGRYDGCYPVKT